MSSTVYREFLSLPPAEMAAGATPPQLFDQPVKQLEHHAAADVETRRVALQSGMTVIELTLSPKQEEPTRLEVPEGLSIFGIVREGSFAIALPDLGRERLTTDDWFILRTSELHYVAHEPLSLLLFVMDSRILEQLIALTTAQKCQTLRCFTCPQLKQPSLLHQAGNERLTWRSNRIRMTDTHDLDERLTLEIRCLEWLRELFRQPELSTRQMCASACSENEEDRLRELAAYLESHLDEEHTLASLGRRFHLNEFKLKRGFKALFGSTVFTHLRTLRIQEAARLLQDTDQSILEVANSVGYANPSHFARNFKDHVGLLPKAYQCIHRSGRR